MKKAILSSVLILALFRVGIVFCQNPISIKLFSESQELNALSFLTVNVSIDNLGADTIEIYPNPLKSRVYLFIAPISEEKWKPLGGAKYGLPRSMCSENINKITNSTLSIAPNTSQSFDFDILPFSNLGSHSIYYFDSEKSYKIKALIYLYSGKKKLEEFFSNEIIVRGVQYKAEELSAFNWLKKLDEPHKFHSVAFEGFWPLHQYEKEHKEAEAFLSKFPNTSFAPWVKLFLVQCLLYEDVDAIAHENKVFLAEKILLSSRISPDRLMQKAMNRLQNEIENEKLKLKH